MRRSWILLLVLFFATCLMPETGTLGGHVSMTMQPVVRENETPPTPSPEAYAVRQVVIFSANGKREIKRVQIDGRGNYQVTLQVGTYVVDINHAGMDRGMNLPSTAVISAQKVTRLDIDIDTGIR